MNTEKTKNDNPLDAPDKGSTTGNSPEDAGQLTGTSKKSSRPAASRLAVIRQTVLVVLLLGAIAAAAYDFGVARPNYHAAIAHLNEVYERSDAAEMTNSDIQQVIGKAPSQVEYIEGRSTRIETYSFSRGLPGATFKLYVWYREMQHAGNDDESVSYYVNHKSTGYPLDDELPGNREVIMAKLQSGKAPIPQIIGFGIGPNPYEIPREGKGGKQVDSISNLIFLDAEQAANLPDNNQE